MKIPTHDQKTTTYSSDRANVSGICAHYGLFMECDILKGAWQNTRANPT